MDAQLDSADFKTVICIILLNKFTRDPLLCFRPHRAEALSDAFVLRVSVCLTSDVCLSRT